MVLRLASREAARALPVRILLPPLIDEARRVGLCSSSLFDQPATKRARARVRLRATEQLLRGSAREVHPGTQLPAVADWLAQLPYNGSRRPSESANAVPSNFCHRPAYGKHQDCAFWWMDSRCKQAGG